MKIPQFLLDRGITRIAALDFETFYSVEYTLKKMSTSLYIYDEQFKAYGAGVRILPEETKSTYYENGLRLQARLQSIDWSKTALLCHHTQFDGLILNYHFQGIQPAFLLCSMSMARPKYRNSVGVNLNDLAKHLGFAGKTSDILTRIKGIHDLNKEDHAEVAEYCNQDVDEMCLVFEQLDKHTLIKEYELIDLTIRMYTRPKFETDIPRIRHEVETQTALRIKTMLDTSIVPDLEGDPLLAHMRLVGLKKKNKKEEITRLSLTEKILRSPVAFAEELKKAGAKVPMKTSKATGSATYAFAKTDKEFLTMAASPDLQIRRLFHGRMAAKSTTALDKAQKLLIMSKYGPIPAYLNYFAAQTGRWSGGDKIQLQNMPRAGEMRKSLIARECHMISVIDSSGIEMRMLAWLSDNQDMLRDITNGIDVYVKMASKIYGVPMDQITKLQRFVGKVAILGLGYGMSAAKFRETLAIGAMGPPVQITLQEANKVVTAYRATNYKVTRLWIQATLWLKIMMADGDNSTRVYKGITFESEQVTLPDGVVLYYPGMKGQYNSYNESWSNFTYKSLGGKVDKYIYGALFVENLTQALARSVIAEQTLNIAKKLPVLLSVHDEAVCETPTPMVPYAENYMYQCFTKQPSWCPDLPLDAEYGSAREYSK